MYDHGGLIYVNKQSGKEASKESVVEAKMNSLNDAKYIQCNIWREKYSVKDGLENNAEGGNINIAKYGLKSSVNIEKERETCAQDDSKNAEKRR